MTAIPSDLAQATTVSMSQWLLRFWLLLTFCWVAAIGHAQRDGLCAAYQWPSPVERAERAAILKKNLAIPGQSSEARLQLIADSERHNAPLPAIECIPSTLSNAVAARSGGITIDWSARAPAVIFWLAPPAIVMLAGLLLLWAAGAFWRGPTAGDRDAVRPGNADGGFGIQAGR
jgi:hypothetical protein